MAKFDDVKEVRKRALKADELLRQLVYLRKSCEGLGLYFSGETPIGVVMAELLHVSLGDEGKKHGQF